MMLQESDPTCTDYIALTEIVFEWADSYDNKVH